MSATQAKNLWLAILFWLVSTFVSMLYLRQPVRGGAYLCAEIMCLLSAGLLLSPQDPWAQIILPYGFLVLRIAGLIDTIRLIQRVQIKDQWYSKASSLPMVISLMFISLLLVRLLVYEPVRIPGRSMEPTLLAGDYLIMQKKAGHAGYGQFQYQVTPPTSSPQVYRGQIIIFKYPKDPSKLYIKRVIGLPGDQLYYSNHKLVINGHIVKQKKVLYGISETDNFTSYTYEETLGTVQYKIKNINKGKNGPHWSLTIPAGKYFVLGDNRSNSQDSREWGLVPASHIVGRPHKIFWSRDIDDQVRWRRLGMNLHTAFAPSQ